MPDCGTPMIKNPLSNDMVCPKCNHKFCFQHGNIDHQPCKWDIKPIKYFIFPLDFFIFSLDTCEKYDEWVIENADPDNRVQDWKDHINTRKCPKCGVDVEKNGGRVVILLMCLRFDIRLRPHGVQSVWKEL